MTGSKKANKTAPVKMILLMIPILPESWAAVIIHFPEKNRKLVAFESDQDIDSPYSERVERYCLKVCLFLSYGGRVV